MTIAAVLANTVVVTNAVAAGVVGGRTDGSAATVGDGRMGAAVRPPRQWQHAHQALTTPVGRDVPRHAGPDVAAAPF